MESKSLLPTFDLAARPDRLTGRVLLPSDQLTASDLLLHIAEAENGAKLKERTHKTPESRSAKRRTASEP